MSVHISYNGGYRELCFEDAPVKMELLKIDCRRL